MEDGKNICKSKAFTRASGKLRKILFLSFSPSVVLLAYLSPFPLILSKLSEKPGDNCINDMKRLKEKEIFYQRLFVEERSY